MKRPLAVVLVVSGGDRDNEIELRDDADVLPASAKRVTSRRISPWCSRPSPVNSGNSVNTPE